MVNVDMDLDIHNPKPVDEPMHDLHAQICGCFVWDKHMIFNV